MSGAVDLFVEEARQVSVAEAADRLGVGGLSRAGTSGEESGPCPACGGTDRFAINRQRNVWNCRGAIGGKDGISLAAHLGGLDIASRDGFLAACAEALGRPLPDEIATETEADKAAREARLAARKAKTAADRDRGERAQADFRDKERAKARGKWEAGFPLTGPEPVDGPAISPQRGETDARTAVRRYLALRLGGHALPALPHLRAIAAEPYWHGKDAAGRAVVLHEGPAMVAPFVDAAGLVIGCHLTWIMGAPPATQRSEELKGGARKGRPILIDPESGAPLPTKKMRGSKKGGFIPLAGFVSAPPLSGKPLAGTPMRIIPDPARTRLVTGEGIENVLAVGLAEGFRADTLYVAAGDLGNLAGPADPKSGFGHPVLKDRGGKRPLRVQGPVPRVDQAPDDAMAVPDQVTEILLVADGDSECWATAAAMLRAERRLSAPPLSSWPAAASLAGAPGSPSASVAKLKDGAKRSIATAWPPAGMDFADLLTAGAPVSEPEAKLKDGAENHGTASDAAEGEELKGGAKKTREASR